MQQKRFVLKWKDAPTIGDIRAGSFAALALGKDCVRKIWPTTYHHLPPLYTIDFWSYYERSARNILRLHAESCGRTTFLLITKHVMWAQRMSYHHNACIVITRHLLRSQHMCYEHQPDMPWHHEIVLWSMHCNNQDHWALPLNLRPLRKDKPLRLNEHTSPQEEPQIHLLYCRHVDRRQAMTTFFTANRSRQDIPNVAGEHKHIEDNNRHCRSWWITERRPKMIEQLWQRMIEKSG